VTDSGAAMSSDPNTLYKQSFRALTEKGVEMDTLTDRDLANWLTDFVDSLSTTEATSEQEDDMLRVIRDRLRRGCVRP
jgi:hypothetical protein